MWTRSVPLARALALGGSALIKASPSRARAFVKLASAALHSFDSLPVIDVGSLRALSDNVTQPSKQVADVASAIGAACRDVGFFYIKNHGVPQDVVSATVAQSQKFFAQPQEVKRALSLHRSKDFRGYSALGEESTLGLPDSKEGFDLGPELPPDHPHSKWPLNGPNQWPPAHLLPDFRPAIDLYASHLWQLGVVLMRAIALSLNLEPNFFSRHFTSNPYFIMRLLHYPPRQNPDPKGYDIGIGEHTDYGCLVILAQDETGGLQVKNTSGQWVDAPHIPDTFIVNLGDMLQVWTDGEFCSTPHRVLNRRRDKDRYSVAFFLEPSFDTVVSPIATLKQQRQQKQFAGSSAAPQPSNANGVYGPSILNTGRHGPVLYGQHLINAVYRSWGRAPVAWNPHTGVSATQP